MAILNQEAISEEEHHEAVEQALLGDRTGCTVPCVRFFAPLVIVALRKANNPFLTGRRGFEAVGVEYDEKGKQLTPPDQFMFLMLTKVAEVLACFSCSQDELKSFALSSEKLESEAMDLLEREFTDDHGNMDMGRLDKAISFISKRMAILSNTQAKKSKEDDKPSAEGLANNGKKKRGHTG